MKKRNAILAVGSIAIAISVLLTLTIPGCYTTLESTDSSAGSGTDQGTDPGAVQAAYNIDELNAYGEWVPLDHYGRSWRPYAVSDWMPFDNGHWAYADNAWTWISYEPFGWMVYHYGYWYNDPIYGWAWIPSGESWSPARVRWIEYDNYVGWAPLPPPGVDYGRPWDSNGRMNWHVVDQRNFTEGNIRSYRIAYPARSSGAHPAETDRPPEKERIDTRVGRVTPEVGVSRETVRLPQREVKKMTLPPGEEKRVEENATRVRKEVLIPREEFKQRHPERKPEPKPAPEKD